MPRAHSYDYAILRVVPRVERGEFLNAGVILSCPGLDYLAARISVPEAALACMAPELDVELVTRHLEAVIRICAGGADSGPIGALDQRARFHWLTAVRSSVIQTSPAHAGTTGRPEVCLERLFQRHVAR
ncbi:MAG: DUF3037 domain-containing protein [Planctomycetota bacterium]